MGFPRARRHPPTYFSLGTQRFPPEFEEEAVLAIRS